MVLTTLDDTWCHPAGRRPAQPPRRRWRRRAAGPDAQAAEGGGALRVRRHQLREGTKKRRKERRVRRPVGRRARPTDTPTRGGGSGVAPELASPLALAPFLCDRVHRTPPEDARGPGARRPSQPQQTPSRVGRLPIPAPQRNPATAEDGVVVTASLCQKRLRAERRAETGRRRTEENNNRHARVPFRTSCRAHHDE